MLSKKQKIECFKRNAVKNYRASLSLEGLSSEVAKKRNSVEELKAKYAR